MKTGDWLIIHQIVTQAVCSVAGVTSEDLEWVAQHAFRRAFQLARNMYSKLGEHLSNDTSNFPMAAKYVFHDGKRCPASVGNCNRSVLSRTGALRQLTRLQAKNESEFQPKEQLFRSQALVSAAIASSRVAA